MKEGKFQGPNTLLREGPRNRAKKLGKSRSNLQRVGQKKRNERVGENKQETALENFLKGGGERCESGPAKGS